MSNRPIVCSGLDGSDPLTLLATAGLFTVGVQTGVVERLGWQFTDAWRPVFVGPGTREQLVDAVLEALAGRKAAETRSRLDQAQRELRLANAGEAGNSETDGDRRPPDKNRLKNLKAECARLEGLWRDEARRGITARHPVADGFVHLDNVAKGGLDRTRFVELARSGDPAPYLAGLAADADLGSGKKVIIARTHLSFSNGGSNKMLLKDFAALASLATAARVEDALFGEGTLFDDITGLGWDPTSQRSYALQFSDPQKEVRCQAVHHALAFLGLALFPVVPAGTDRATLGVYAFPAATEVTQAEDDADEDADNSPPASGKATRMVDHLTWPIWEASLGLDDVRALFARRELAERAPLADRCRSVGIASVYRCRRFALNKRSYFSPARPVF